MVKSNLDLPYLKSIRCVMYNFLVTVYTTIYNLFIRKCKFRKLADHIGTKKLKQILK